jgi:hypothetical protein
MKRTYLVVWLVFLSTLLVLDSWVFFDTKHILALSAILMEAIAIGMLLIALVTQPKK